MKVLYGTELTIDLSRLTRCSKLYSEGDVVTYNEIGRTKIPDPPIHFSGPTNFFGRKIDFTNHQF
jgi:hypothetical protein